MVPQDYSRDGRQTSVFRPASGYKIRTVGRWSVRGEVQGAETPVQPMALCKDLKNTYTKVPSLPA